MGFDGNALNKKIDCQFLFFVFFGYATYLLFLNHGHDPTLHVLNCC